MNIKSKMAIFAKKNGLKVESVVMNYDFEAVQFNFDSDAEYDAIFYKLARLKNIHVDKWAYYDGGVFDGTLRVMLLSDFQSWKKVNESAREKLNDWWERYHEADEETRKLMACGKIA